jgi:hypothetical protein
MLPAAAITLGLLGGVLQMTMRSFPRVTLLAGVLLFYIGFSVLSFQKLHLYFHYLRLC